MKSIISKKKKIKIVVLLLFLCVISYSQNNGLKLNLDATGETYIKASFRTQFWTRYMDMNPGTTINNETVSNKIDFSIRRIRLGISAQLTPKLYVYSLFGGNNINMKSEKNFAFDILDLSVEYAFFKEFALGIGENAWYGLSRWTARSSASLMTLDAPLFSLLNVNKNDDLARGLGIWAKGQVGKFDYVISIKNPTTYGVEAKEGKTDYSLKNPALQTSAYIKYEFLDNEGNKSAYSGAAGTYMGKKQIFNIGAGFLFQPKMTSQLVKGIEKYYDFKNWAMELFYNAPINKNSGTAITTYLGYFNTDFGPNYIRNVGANDYTEGGTSFNGSGNDFPMMGTGNTLFFQLGYILPKNLLGKRNSFIKIQPNTAIQYSNFEALNDPMVVYDLGVNVFFKGHASKLSVNYQSRPIYAVTSTNEVRTNQRKGQWVLQYQITVK